MAFIDTQQIASFAEAIYRHADPDGFVSLRSFREHDLNWASISGVRLGKDLGFLIGAAVDGARAAAYDPEPTVFCPPVALFGNRSKASEKDLLQGPALSVECDANPGEARRRLEDLLGPATVVVESGGEWTAPNGAAEPKLHLHWRLNEPATGDALKSLKEARKLAAALIGGDASNVPISHPIRWPGSLWRKQEPARLARIVTLNPDTEIDLGQALDVLREASGELRSGNGTSPPHEDSGERVDVGRLTRNILEGKDLHHSTLRLSASYLSRGMAPGAVVNALRDLLRQIPEENRDTRWQARFDDLPRLVRTGHEQFGDPFAPSLEPGWDAEGRQAESDRPEPQAAPVPPWQGWQAPRKGTGTWDDPDVSLLEDGRSRLPSFPADALPPLWQDWLSRAAAGAGVSPGFVAVPLLGIAGGLIGTCRRIKAAGAWTEPLAVWALVVSLSGHGKTPGLMVLVRALDELMEEQRPRIDELRREHETKQRIAKLAEKQWLEDLAAAMAEDSPGAVPTKPAEADDPGPFFEPKLSVSDTTIEKIPALIQAKPRGVLYVLDEASQLFLNLQRYSRGTDDPFWLKAWTGMSHSVERQGRPSAYIKNLLVGITGGIQPTRLFRCFGGVEGEGLSARPLYAFPTKAGYQPLSDDAIEIEPFLLNALRRLAELSEDTRTLTLTRAARTRFEAFRQSASATASTLLIAREREVWAKSETQVLRLAGILTLVEWAGCQAERLPGAEPTVVEAETLAAAIGLWEEYFWPHACACMRVVSRQDTNIEVRAILGWLRDQLDEGVTEVSREEVRRKALGHHFDTEQTQKFITRLHSAGWLRFKETATGGRPIVRYEINPMLTGMRF